MLLNIKNSSYDIKKILKVACNVDGVLRDEFGAWICGVAWSMGCCLVLLTEI